MPITTESTTVEVTVSRTNSAQPIITVMIATIFLLGKRIAKTMDIAGIFPLIIVMTIVSHAVIEAVTTCVIITRTMAIEAERNSTVKINATEKITSRVLIFTKLAA